MRHRSEKMPCAYCVLCVRAHPPVCMCAVFVSKEAHSQVSHKHAFLPLQQADKRVLQSAHDGLGLGPRGVGECHIRHFVIAYDSRARGEEYRMKRTSIIFLWQGAAEQCKEVTTGPKSRNLSDLIILEFLDWTMNLPDEISHNYRRYVIIFLFS